MDPVQPVEAQHPIQPPTPSSSKHLLITVFVAIITAVLASGGTYMVMSSQGKKSAQVVYAQPTTIQPSPTIPQPSVTSTPTGSINKEKTFTNIKYGYSVSYPAIYESSDGTVEGPPNSDTSTLLINTSGTGAPGFPVFYVDVLSQDGTSTNVLYNFDGFTKNAKSYLTTKVGEVVKPENQPWNATFTRLADVTVNGKTALVFESYAFGQPSESGLIDRRLVVQKGKYVYIIGTYYVKTQPDSWSTYQRILTSFTFTN